MQLNPRFHVSFFLEETLLLKVTAFLVKDK